MAFLLRKRAQKGPNPTSGAGGLAQILVQISGLQCQPIPKNPNVPDLHVTRRKIPGTDPHLRNLFDADIPAVLFQLSVFARAAQENCVPTIFSYFRFEKRA